jgi:hypothetical protein
LEATISSSSIKIDESSGGSAYKSDGGLTTDIIKGSWDSNYYGIYYSGEYTLTDGLILSRQ